MPSRHHGMLLTGMFTVEPSESRYIFGGDESFHVLDGAVSITADGAPMVDLGPVTLTIEQPDAEPGGRWAGHLRVEPFADGDGMYSFDGPIDATVCPAVSL